MTTSTDRLRDVIVDFIDNESNPRDAWDAITSIADELEGLEAYCRARIAEFCRNCDVHAACCRVCGMAGC